MSGRLPPMAKSIRMPYAVCLKDERPFSFAGLWDRWQHGSEIIESCTIITTDANELLKPIHDRMPVILSEDAYERWLDPSTQNAAAFQPLLKPYNSEAMKVYPVSTRMNDPKNDDEKCIEPLTTNPVMS